MAPAKSSPKALPNEPLFGVTTKPMCCTIQRAAELTGLSADTVRRRIRDGSLRARKVVGRVLIDFGDLERMAGHSMNERPTSLGRGGPSGSKKATGAPAPIQPCQLSVEQRMRLRSPANARSRPITLPKLRC
jgi:excisionase family DNA binding protein